MRFIRRNAFILTALILTLLAGALQTHGFALAWGVRPNLMLATLIILGLFINEFAFYLLFVLLGSISIAPHPGFSPEVLVLMAIVLVCYYLTSRRVTHSLLGVALIVLVAPVVFYLILDTSFVITHPVTVLLESVYTLGIAVLLYELLTWLRQRLQ